MRDDGCETCIGISNGEEMRVDRYKDLYSA